MFSYSFVATPIKMREAASAILTAPCSWSTPTATLLVGDEELVYISQKGAYSLPPWIKITSRRAPWPDAFDFCPGSLFARSVGGLQYLWVGEVLFPGEKVPQVVAGLTSSLERRRDTAVIFLNPKGTTVLVFNRKAEVSPEGMIPGLFVDLPNLRVGPAQRAVKSFRFGPEDYYLSLTGKVRNSRGELVPLSSNANFNIRIFLRRAQEEGGAIPVKAYTQPIGKEGPEVVEIGTAKVVRVPNIQKS